ncbi:hypothetical protein HRbin36_00679 [bacterium HR36]|nr:hypothetical protein HRbin36_00679 [bacterium HR36]
MSLARLRAPAEHGQILVAPPADTWGRLVAENAQLWRKAQLQFCGILLADWRQSMRQLVSEWAAAQLRRWGTLPAWPATGWLVTGHQPEFFHPGVWAKHIALAEAARRLGLAPLNLVADHDQPKTLALRVPTTNDHTLSVAWVPFCQAAPGLAWEEYLLSSECGSSHSYHMQTNDSATAHVSSGAGASCCSRELLLRLPSHVLTVAGNLLPELVLPQLWSHLALLADRFRSGGSLAELLAGARRLWEERWELHNGELRVSTLCGAEGFLAFVAEILTNLPAFVQMHNAELAAYRREHRLRSRTHPVPPLLLEGDWCEAPFWVWCPGQPRQRLWVQRAPGMNVLRLGEHGRTLNIPLARSLNDLREFADALRAANWKIRPRALTLTLFVRLFVAEMFIHGIGGGVYDRFTDRLLQRYWRLEPPRYAVVSATLHLPLPRPTPPPHHRDQLLHHLRDCRYNPERVLPPEIIARPEVQHLVARKRELLRQWPGASLEQRRALHRELSAIRRALQPLAAVAAAQIRSALEAVAAYEEQLALAEDREWAWVLHSDRALTQLVARMREEFARLGQ